MKKKEWIAATLSVLMIAAPTGQIFAAGETVDAELTTDYSNGAKNYIVVLKEGETADSVASLLNELDVVEPYNSEPMEKVMERNMLFVSLTPSEAMDLALDERICSVEEDVIVRAMENGEAAQDDDVIDERPAYEWNLAAIHATPEELYQYSTDESVIRIAVLDSGTCIIEDVEVREYVNLVSEEDDIFPLYADSTGHGTAVAGIIAAKDDDEGIIGVAPDASLYSVKVFDTVNEAPISRIIRGIYWAIDHDINIVNMSFGTTVNSYALHQAVQDAYRDGILMVAAAGNKGVVEYPAAYNEVIAVGAVDHEGRRSEFSATGESLELMAPGECVLSDSFYGGVMAVDGTSIATPHVAGAAAVLWAKDTTKSNDFIRQLLNVSANSSQDTSAEYGNGILDVKRAFEIYGDFEAVYVPGVNEYSEITENVAEYVIGDEPEYVVGSWGASEHNSSIQTGASADSSLFNTKNIKVMQWISRRLDTDFAATKSVSNFHAGRAYETRSYQKADNYVNDLFFLYEVAIGLKVLPSGSSVEQQKTVVDTVANNRKNLNSVSIHSGLINQVKDLLTYTTAATTNGVTYSESELKTAQVNAIKILGAAVHLAGDIYAHRILVPSTATGNAKDSATSITGNYFAKNHFDEASVGEICSVDVLAETAYNIHSGVTLCDHHTWECFERAVKNLSVEFKDINTWTKTSIGRGTYEDNPKFYDERFSIGTNYTVKYIMKKYKDGMKTLDENVLIPGANGQIFNLKLNHLKGHYQAAGLNWAFAWSAYTTEDIR